MKNISIILGIITLIYASCNKQKSQPTTAEPTNAKYLTLTEQQIKAGNIKLEKLSEQNFDGVVEVTGVVEVPPAQMSAVNSLMSGIVKKIQVNEGQYIQKGQVLFYVESQDFITLQQEFATLNEKLGFLKNDYERQYNLYQENANTEKKYLQAESEYKSNLAFFKGLKKKLELLGVNVNTVLQGDYYASLPIYAPISGNIKSINALNGSFIDTAVSVIEIINTAKANIVLQVYETQLKDIKVNQKLSFTTSYGKSYQATIKFIGAALNNDTKTIQVMAQIDEPIKIFSGIPVQAKIITHSQNNKAISSKAIISEDKENYIYVLHHKDKGNYYFEKKPIKITMKNEIWTAFDQSTDTEDKEIITEGANMLNF